MLSVFISVQIMTWSGILLWGFGINMSFRSPESWTVWERVLHTLYGARASTNDSHRLPLSSRQQTITGLSSRCRIHCSCVYLLLSSYLNCLSSLESDYFPLNANHGDSLPPLPLPKYYMDAIDMYREQWV